MPPSPPPRQAAARRRQQPAEHEVHPTGQARAACSNSSGLQLELSPQLVAPVVIVAHNRVNYLAKAIMTVLRYWQEDPSYEKKFPLFVSADGGHQPTMRFASALNFGAKVQVIHNLRDPSRCKAHEGYCNLSLHYQMLLQLFLECHKAPRLLFLEEDLEIAPDFFSYFEALAPLLDADPTVLCISAWNDHGQLGRASNATALYRTDIMPGLGWMTSAAIGNELHPKWPNLYWDDWLRQPENRKDRQCVFPEVARTHTFGKAGTSGGQFFDTHLATMAMNHQRINWSAMDLSYLRSDAYAAAMAGWLAAAEELPEGEAAARCAVRNGGGGDGGAHDDAAAKAPAPDLVMHYKAGDMQDFKRVARLLPPMLPDHKGGRPRASYNGTVVVRCQKHRLFIAPR